MAVPLDILFFGDQTGDHFTSFQHALHVKDDVLLTAFFEKCYLTLRHEVAQQSLSVREQIPCFSSIGDLVSRYAEPNVCESNVLESTLTCISQLACFFRWGPFFPCF